MWELSGYKNSELDRDDNDLGWLFASLPTDNTIVENGTEFRHPDLEDLSTLLVDAKNEGIDNVVASAKKLISIHARGQVFATIAARNNLQETEQMELLNLLLRKDHKPRVSFQNQWAAVEATVKTLEQRDDLSEKSKAAIAKLKKSDPQFIAEQHLQHQARMEKRKAQQLAKQQERLEANQRRQDSAQKRMADQQARQIKAQLKQQSEQAELLQKQSERLQQQSKQLLKQSEEAKKKSGKNQPKRVK